MANPLRQNAIASAGTVIAAIRGAEVETASTPTSISRTVRTAPLSGTLEDVPDASADLARDPALHAALVAELAKRTGVCWLTYRGATHPVWHLWLDGALCLVSGGDEQQLPGIESVDRVEVSMRSKHTGGRLVTWEGAVAVVRPGDELWDRVTSALVQARLNLRDPSTAAAQWARTSVVTRITPT